MCGLTLYGADWAEADQAVAHWHVQESDWYVGHAVQGQTIMLTSWHESQGWGDWVGLGYTTHWRELGLEASQAASDCKYQAG